MSSKIALRLTAALVFGAAFAAAPALAQQASASPQMPSHNSRIENPAPGAGGATFQQAQYWRWGPRPWWGGGVYYNFVPGAIYNYSAPAIGNSVAWCEARFRSYNPATGMYLGYDGYYHSCP